MTLTSIGFFRRSLGLPGKNPEEAKTLLPAGSLEKELSRQLQ